MSIAPNLKEEIYITINAGFEDEVGGLKSETPSPQSPSGRRMPMSIALNLKEPWKSTMLGWEFKAYLDNFETCLMT